MCDNKFGSDWPIHYRGNTCRHTYGADLQETHYITSEKRDEKWSVNPVLSADYW